MRWTDDLSRRNSLRGYEGLSSTRKILPFDDAPPPTTTTPQRTINNLSLDNGTLPRIKPLPEEETDLNFGTGSIATGERTPPSNGRESAGSIERIKKIFMFFEPKGCLKERDDFSLYFFPPNNRYVIAIIFLNFNLD